MTLNVITKQTIRLPRRKPQRKRIAAEEFEANNYYLQATELDDEESCVEEVDSTTRHKVTRIAWAIFDFTKQACNGRYHG
jgi:hypothetical protein